MYGRAIRHKRKEQGKTLADVAEPCGVSHVTLSRHERGDRQPDRTTLRCYAEQLGSSIEELAQLDEELRQEETREVQATGSRTKMVSSNPDISAWRDQVLRDPEIEGYTQMVLVALPMFMDKTSWIVTVDVESFAEETGRSEEVVQEHLEKAMNTEYVERIGQLKYVARLVFT